MPLGLHQANLFRYLMQLFPHGIKKVHIFLQHCCVAKTEKLKTFYQPRCRKMVVKTLIFQIVFLGTLYSNLDSTSATQSLRPIMSLVHSIENEGPYDYNLNILWSQELHYKPSELQGHLLNLVLSCFWKTAMDGRTSFFLYALEMTPVEVLVLYDKRFMNCILCDAG